MPTLFEITTNDDETALAIAPRAGHIDIVRLLQDAGSATNMTALMSACQDGHAEVLRWLLEAGAYPNSSRNDDWTGLMIDSSGAGNVEVLHVLLQSRANPDLATSDGRPGLMHACQEGHLQALQLLLEAGASPNLAGNDGWTALKAGICERSCRSRALAAGDVCRQKLARHRWRDCFDDCI